MAGRGELREARLRLVENLLRLVEAALLEQRAPEHNLCVADLVEEVRAVAEQLQCVPGLLLGELVVARTEMHLRQRRHRLCGIRIAARLERNRECLLQMG